MSIANNLRQMQSLTESAMNAADQPEARAKLKSLLAEMQDLAKVLPAANAPDADPYGAGRAEIVALSEEDAVEDGFDNMPL